MGGAIAQCVNRAGALDSELWEAEPLPVALFAATLQLAKGS